ncbi:DUF397 domain-containing protein [Streptomyces sp. NPDC055078]
MHAHLTPDRLRRVAKVPPDPPSGRTALLSQHPLAWRRSSRSTGANNCVEAARLPDSTLAVRDSKAVTRRPLHFSPEAWSRFLTGVGSESVG